MKKEKKYELVKEDFIEVDCKILYRIKALRDFDTYCIKAGTLGGYIEKEGNLSHDGLCWVYDNAKVYDNAYVSGNVKVCGNAKVHDNARIRTNAEIRDNAEICGNAYIYGNAKVHDNALVYDNVKVYGSAEIYGYAKICRSAEIYEKAKIYNNALVYGNAKVYGWAEIYGYTEVGHNADIYRRSHVIPISNLSSRNDIITFFRNKVDDHYEIYVRHSLEFLSIDTFKSKLMSRYSYRKSGKEYEAVIEMVKAIIKL